VTSALLERPDGLVDQRPRIFSAPTAVSSTGPEVVELCAQVGVYLDEWQAFALEHAMGERADGKWSAFEVGVVVSRQNGKGEILLARELAALFLLDERLVLHSAHQFKTAREGFLRLAQVIENNDALRRRCKKPRRAAGQEGIETLSGQRVNFVARSEASGRGFTGNCIILDEAYELGSAEMSALMPTVSAVPNPQLWYTSSAGMERSTQLASVRARGLRGGDKHLAFMEWSIPDGMASDDRQGWRMANPSMLAVRPDGSGVTEESIEREHASLPEDVFRRERLGVPDDVNGTGIISTSAWEAAADRSPDPPRPSSDMAFALHSRFDRSATAIVMCGQRPDGYPQVEIIDSRPGVTWAVDRLAELRDRYRPCATVVDPRSGAGSLIADLEDAGLEIVKMTAQDVAQAFGMFYDGVLDGSLRHTDQPEMNGALAGATRRPVNEAWTWDGKGDTDIKSLVAATNALWGWTTRHGSGELQIF
jgi:phage terminase large subunit-like protein